MWSLFIFFKLQSRIIQPWMLTGREFSLEDIAGLEGALGDSSKTVKIEDYAVIFEVTTGSTEDFLRLSEAVNEWLGGLD